MAVTGEVVIMNGALIKLRAERILSPDDNNARARLMKERYPVVRDALLRSHPWNFATSYASLAPISPFPEDVFEYSYAFQLPSDCLRVYATSLCDDEEWEEIEGGRIVCDSSELKVKFIRRITDVTKFDDNFVILLEWALAKDTAYGITQSTEKEKNAGEEFDKQLRAVRSFDAQVGSARRVIVGDDWLAARR